MQQIETVSDAIHTHLGVGGKTLAQQMRRAGRLLPRHVRAQANLLVQAEALSGNPRVQRQLSATRLAQATTTVLTHLTAIDRKKQRQDRFLSILAGIAVQIIVVFVGFLIALRTYGAI
ncbi:hypothetical protein [uncultured Roseobacter sp.]|uniref:hypothetical protein n=1 Tax=uncultured Roseobacter sp. TaxID=114847 RepID=UPI00260BE530|nr:hypothetical protein [uncultured Roseobacter sp.]